MFWKNLKKEDESQIFQITQSNFSLSSFLTIFDIAISVYITNSR